MESLYKIHQRAQNLEMGLIESDNIYPLNINYKENYDFENIKNSIKNWKNYSNLLENNLVQIVELLGLIKDNGNESELNEAVSIITNNILPYIKIDRKITKIFSEAKIENQELMESMNDIIYYDGIIQNYNTLNKEYNMDRLINKDFNMELSEDSTYRLCTIIDNKLNDNESLQDRYYTINELCLYGINNNELLEEIIPKVIVDYMVTTYITEDEKILDHLESFAENGKFIPKSVLDYIREFKFYINEVADMVDELFTEEAFLVLKEFDEYKTINSLNESILGKSWDNKINKNFKQIKSSIKTGFNNIHSKMKIYFAKFKMSANKGIDSTKEFIKKAFSDISKDDVKEAVKTILKIAFFAVVTIGAIAIAAIAGLISFICLLIYKRWFSDAAQLREAIETLKDHKEEATRQMITEPVIQRKQRLQEYVTNLDRQISAMEEKAIKIHDNGSTPIDPIENFANTAKNVATSAAGAIIGYNIAKRISNDNNNNDNNKK